MTLRTVSQTLACAAALCGCAAGALAQKSPAPAGPFEEPADLPSSQFLGQVPLSGPEYTISAATYNDGLLNTYRFTTRSGVTAEILGTEAVANRAAEAMAVADLRRVSTGEMFGKALGGDAGAKLKAAGNAVIHPLKTIGAVPKGASRFFGKIGESLKGGKSEYEDKAYTDMAGASAAKRKIAAQYGVNPYTTNPELEDELNKVAWVQAGVGMAVNIGLGAATSGAAGLAVTAVNMSQRLRQRLIDQDPANLRIENRKALLALGMTRDQTEPFLKHPWFSPAHTTIICDALSALGPKAGAAGFIEVATRAAAEEDAYFFQRNAQLIKEYHRTEAPITQLTPSRLICLCADTKGRIFIPVHLDYAVWSEFMASRIESLLGESKGKMIVVWTTGQFSPRLQQELTARGIAFRTGVKPMAD